MEEHEDEFENETILKTVAPSEFIRMQRLPYFFEIKKSSSKTRVVSIVTFAKQIELVDKRKVFDTEIYHIYSKLFDSRVVRKARQGNKFIILIPSSPP